ncbi:thermonuclease family protein [Teichococcus vastitatis]|uniref:thermonuclease family protein n=1 Tax=Teichococcus vastitatis TaxID=2307076 RepID=UPI001EE41389|nr:thermonuclease family protein [Pseudoroseomonas vastitatis]
MPVLRLLLVSAVLLLFSFPALAAELRGEVVGISDGDTLTLLTPDKRQARVRLAEIDAPESRQPWGSRAQQALSALVFRKAVVVAVQDTDRYGRTVGTVWVGRLNANAEMIRQGHAWVYRQYLRDRSLLALEDEVRQASAGCGRCRRRSGCRPGLTPAAALWTAGAVAQTAGIRSPRHSRLQLRQALLLRDEQLLRGTLSPASMQADSAGLGITTVSLREPLLLSEDPVGEGCIQFEASVETL